MEFVRAAWCGAKAARHSFGRGAAGQDQAAIAGDFAARALASLAASFTGLRRGRPGRVGWTARSRQSAGADFDRDAGKGQDGGLTVGQRALCLDASSRVSCSF